MSPKARHYESLFDAVSNLDAEDVKRHLALGTNIDQKYDFGEGKFGTLLHIFAGIEQAPQVELMLAFGADPNLRDNAGETPLHSAALNGNAQIAEALLASDADPDLVENEFGWTALHKAASLGHLEFVRVLLAEGAEPRVKGPTGVTPLLLAANNNHRAVAQLLAAPLTVEDALMRDIVEARAGR